MLLTLVFCKLAIWACSLRSELGYREYEWTYGCATYDHSYTVTVTREGLDASPSWWAEQDNPPLPAKRALQLATEKATQVLGERPGPHWKLESMQLIPAGTCKWFWLFRYVEDGTCCVGIPLNLTLAVLMDGSIVPLQIDPEGEKKASSR
jgi:hypothetical protein